MGNIKRINHLHLPHEYEQKIKWFIQKYGVLRERDWKQLLVQRVSNLNNIKKWKRYYQND